MPNRFAMRIILPACAALLAIAAMPAAAQPVPPPGAMALSRIIAHIEQTRPVASFVEVEWEDDGYWEVEYLPRDGGRKVKLRIDPMTGDSLSRDRRRH